MKRIASLILLIAAVATAVVASDADRGARFTAVDVFVDSGNAPLAAWQIDFRATAGEVRVTGIEGASAGSVYAQPPYYDPKAMQGDRVILAAFSTAPAAKLPTGKTRVATIHLLVRGGTPPQYTTTLTAAADNRGESINATITLVEDTTS